jgi:hypothetical protein
MKRILLYSAASLTRAPDCFKLLTAVAEQQLIEAKRQRDAEVKAINTHIQLMGQGQAVPSDQSSNCTSAMLG